MSATPEKLSYSTRFKNWRRGGTKEEVQLKRDIEWLIQRMKVWIPNHYTYTKKEDDPADYEYMDYDKDEESEEFYLKYLKNLVNIDKLSSYMNYMKEKDKLLYADIRNNMKSTYNKYVKSPELIELINNLPETSKQYYWEDEGGRRTRTRARTRTRRIKTRRTRTRRRMRKPR